jgi:hypothetical protein
VELQAFEQQLQFGLGLAVTGEDQLAPGACAVSWRVR